MKQIYQYISNEVILSLPIILFEVQYTPRVKLIVDNYVGIPIFQIVLIISFF
jgi:hypothetical protein